MGTPTVEIVDRVGKLNVWKQGDQRAPHKPLLLLYVIGQYLQGKPRLVPYAEVESPLRRLLAPWVRCRGVGPGLSAHGSAGTRRYRHSRFLCST